MGNPAFDFMEDDRRPHVYGEAREKILALVQEIDNIYKAQMRKSTGYACDICKAGDINERFKVSDCLTGYEHREQESPRLCYSHACGWRLSFRNIESSHKAAIVGVNRKSSLPFNRMRANIEIANTVFDGPVMLDEEVDLHFAKYLVNQLKKEARNV
jgi:hypothetical protein